MNSQHSSGAAAKHRSRSRASPGRPESPRTWGSLYAHTLPAGSAARRRCQAILALSSNTNPPMKDSHLSFSESTRKALGNYLLKPLLLWLFPTLRTSTDLFNSPLLFDSRALKFWHMVGLSDRYLQPAQQIGSLYLFFNFYTDNSNKRLQPPSSPPQSFLPKFRAEQSIPRTWSEATTFPYNFPQVQRELETLSSPPDRHTQTEANT